MRRRTFVAMGILALPLVACGTESPTRSTSSNSVTATSEPNIAPTQTQTADLAQVSALQTQAAPKPATGTAQAAATSVPTAAPTATTVRTPTTRPSPTIAPKIDLATENVSNYTDSIGSLYFIGELVNNGQIDATAIQIAISLIDATGNTIGSGQASTVGVYILKPGQRTVWSALITSKLTEWKEQRIQVQGGPVTAIYASTFADGLIVSGVTVNPPANQYSFVTATGQVQNNGAAVAKFPSVTLGAYDASGQLTSVSLGTAALQEVAPGATAPFTITLLNTKVLPTTYKLYVKGSK